jgi:hypothetical protein
MEHNYILLIIMTIVIFILFSQNTNKYEKLEINNNIPYGYIKCQANEMCNNAGDNDVYYGAGDKFIKRKLEGPFKCDAILFGDPGTNCVNACYIPDTNPVKLPHGYEKCAKEDEQCLNYGENMVYYGSKTDKDGNPIAKGFFPKKMKGEFTCSGNKFGNPVQSTSKACYVPVRNIVELPEAGYKECAKEGEKCEITGKNKVYFGFKGDNLNDFYSKDVKGTFECATNQFGDPVPGKDKKCYVPDKQVTKLPTGYDPCAVEGDMCNNNIGESLVYYGAGDKFYSKKKSGPFVCDSDEFGNPNPTANKVCYLPTKPNSVPAAEYYVKCGDENSLCNNEGTNLVYYGTKNKFNKREMTGQFKCSDLIFGNLPGDQQKSCYVPK